MHPHHDRRPGDGPTVTVLRKREGQWSSAEVQVLHDKMRPVTQVYYHSSHQEVLIVVGVFEASQVAQALGHERFRLEQLPANDPDLPFSVW